MMTTSELSEDLTRMGYCCMFQSVGYAQEMIIWRQFSGNPQAIVAQVNCSAINDFSIDFPHFRDELDIEQKVALAFLLDEYAKTPLRYR